MTQIHLQLALACEGGGGHVNGIEIRHKSTSGLLLHAREVEDVRMAWSPTWFAHKGGRGGSVS
jgi:hypothetical protein